MDAQPTLLDAITNERPVLVVKSKVSADRLAKWNVAATFNADGAKWKPEHLKDADIILVPDDIGWRHSHVVGGLLRPYVKRIRVLVLSDLHPGLQSNGDGINWIDAIGTGEQLNKLIDKAVDWTPPSEKLADLEKEKEKEKKAAKKADAAKSEDELVGALAKIDALAKMPKGIERAQKTRKLAKDLHVNRSDVEAEIQARQVEAETKALLHGHWFVDPWPEVVDGEALIRDIIRKVRKHVVISFEGALAIALWIVLAWVHDEIAIHSPLLVITSVDPNSGKTTLLVIVSLLLLRAISTVDISRGALYRSIQRWQPSFAIDEFDNVLDARNDTDKSELRSVVNSGHARGQGVLRCVTDDHRPELFSTFAPKTVGMVGRKMPPTTLSRCIFIEMKRKKKDEKVEKFEHKDDPELADLRSRLFRWSLDNADALGRAKPSMPDVFDNRLGDNWRLQFAIADLCSGVEDWGSKARDAAKEIEKGSDSRTGTGRLLAAIKIIFDSIGTDADDAIGSQELCDKLAADPEFPDLAWALWRQSRKSISQHQLARLLKPLHIFPDQVRPKALRGEQVRGYKRSQFEDSWARYV